MPEEVYEHYRQLTHTGKEAEEKWNEMFASYSEAYPELREELDNWYDEESGKSLLDDDEYWKRENKADATRNISGKALNYIKDRLPNLVGGSADLGPSNKTVMNGAGDFSYLPII